MLKERREAANLVAEKLFAVEAAIDAAVRAAAELTASMPTAAGIANLSTCIGQDALMAAMETTQQLVQARAKIISTHEALRETQISIGLGQVGFNDLSGCPPKTASAEAPVRRHLTVAA